MTKMSTLLRVLSTVKVLDDAANPFAIHLLTKMNYGSIRNTLRTAYKTGLIERGQLNTLKLTKLGKEIIHKQGVNNELVNRHTQLLGARKKRLEEQLNFLDADVDETDDEKILAILLKPEKDDTEGSSGKDSG